MSELYLVYTSEAPEDLSDSADMAVLGGGLFLVRTDRGRSRLYHDIKRRLRPRTLLVAPLAGLPKFKGMQAGSSKAAKRLERD